MTNLNDNINSLFSSLSSTFSHTSAAATNSQAPKLQATTLSNPNTLVKSFAYNEDKNLKFRQSMEDTGTMNINLTTDYKHSLFCIYDGHGGIDVVNFIKDRMPTLIQKSIESREPYETAFENSFIKVDEELKYYDSDYTGATATVVLIEKNILYCANVGDSKAFIITTTEAKQITVDHKCTVPSEAERIEKNGGKIQKGRVNGQLILSRTLGDLNSKKFGVSPIPSISKNEIGNNVKFCVIASDGVWDVVDSNNLFEMSKNVTNADDFSKKIVKTAIDKGSRDNISTIVISFI